MNARRYKCPSCGAGLEFDSTLQEMKCPYCQSVFPVEDFLEVPADTGNQATDTDRFGMYRCETCGAEIIAEESTAATNCPYCSNPVILTGQVSGEWMPDYIIPFQLDKEAAKAALRKHLKGKKLLPKVFTTEHHLDEVKGVYVPFWLFDTTAEAGASYAMTKTRLWSDSHYEYTETSDFEAVRSGTIRFENIPADGARKMADDLMESLETFDFQSAVPFDPVYMAGYFADKYDVSAEENLDRITERIKTSAFDALLNTVQGYETVRQTNGTVRLRDTQIKYAMYPVWILNTTWRGQNYRFAMNGQTGKLVGDLPIDNFAYWKWRLLYGLGFAGVLYAAMWALGIL
ncbi:MAG: hypothetical protein IJ237_02525 [Oscillospiraceae bacterium]|nr:hypothetical protein [Oscillospiraceae bacterium]